MPSLPSDSWKICLIPQAVANGLASLLVLFFLISDLHGGLLDVGLVAGLSALALVPSQMLWGRLVDGTGRCKPFLVVGFMGMGASLAAMPWAGGVSQLLALVSLKSVLYAATVPARQLLTVESEHHAGWQRGLANMQFLSGLGETIGMGVGAVTVSSLGYTQLFLVCGVLCVISAALLGAFAIEPGFMIQRRLVALERSTSSLVTMSDFVTSPMRLSDGFAGTILRRLEHSTKFLVLGILSFSLAGSALFSPLPAYFLHFYSSSLVFLVFFAGSLAGTVCYLVVGRLAQSAGKSLVLASAVRMVVIPLLLMSAIGATPGLVVAVVVISTLESFWSLFDVTSTFAFLEGARVGQAGFYGAIVGLGAAGGGVLGGFVSMQFGFACLFGLSSVVCALALAAFALQFRGAG
jgi:MFS family permease